MALPKGTITVDVLKDGTTRIESGDMGGVAHKAADAFFTEMAKMLGGTVTDLGVKHEHTHHHQHADHHLKQ